MSAAQDKANEFIRRHGIQKIRLVFADQNGLMRGKNVPAEIFLKGLEKGFGFAQSIFAMDIEGETIAESGLLWEHGDPDYRALPDLDTLTLVPWKEHTAQVIVDAIVADDRPFFADPRHILKKILNKLAEAGHTARVASELEFYLLHGDTRQPATTGTQAYSILHIVAVEKILEQIEKNAGQMDIPLEATLSEYAPGQFEINLRYEDALRMADHTFLFRNMVKETVQQLGYHATFMAKPFADSAGSSFHLHMSLWKDGHNVFARRSSEGDLPGILQSFIAGCQQYLNPAMAFFAPHVNSYKRLRPGSYAPINDSWGWDNRSVSLRMPAAEGNACRLENRIPGADGNPYLVIAAALAIGWLGMHEKLAPKPQVSGNAYELPSTVPRDLHAALDELQASPKIVQLLGEEFIHVYTAVKRAEWRKYVGTITEWEKMRYFELM